MAKRGDRLENIDILTVQEAADYLRVSRSTIWRWCRDGTLSSAFKIGRTWRIHKSEVEGIIRQGVNQEGKSPLSSILDTSVP